jgi:hypothetical protein
MSPIATFDAIHDLLAGAIPSRPPHGFAYLATVDESGIARVRTMTLRGYDPATGTLWTTSHVESQKVRHLRQHAAAELCLWLGAKGVQLRMQAVWRVIDAGCADPLLLELRRVTWDQQPAESRALYPPVAAGEVPEPFALLWGVIDAIDALHLGPTTYAHYRHERVGRGWESQKMNR